MSGIVFLEEKPRMTRETVYDRYLKLKAKLKKDYPDLTDKEFYKLAGKLASWHYKKKRWNGMELSKEEARMYEWILNQNYSPDTVYKWYRTLGFSKEIQEQIKNKKLTYNEAKTYPKPFRRLTSLESDFMYDIKQCFERYLVR